MDVVQDDNKFYNGTVNHHVTIALKKTAINGLHLKGSHAVAKPAFKAVSAEAIMARKFCE